jgi:NAD dependent epimerase/dehydratase family
MQGQRRLFIFGWGYTAATIAREAMMAGWSVAASTRNPAKMQAMAAAGVEPWVFGDDRGLHDPRAALHGCNALLSCVPPDPQGAPPFDPILRWHGPAIARLAVSRSSPPLTSDPAQLAWIGYLSSTTVYGDSGGAWVDESAPLRPSHERARRRVAAEDAWRALWRDGGAPVHCFRLPGIYGPGRSPINNLRAGTAQRIDKPGQVFCRIHVDDIAQAILASLRQPRSGAIYNLADDVPESAVTVMDYAALLLGLPLPELIHFDNATLSPMAASFYADCRRVRNDLIKRELGLTWRYPSYREGLGAILAAEAASAPSEACMPPQAR